MQVDADDGGWQLIGAGVPVGVPLAGLWRGPPGRLLGLPPTGRHGGEVVRSEPSPDQGPGPG